MNEAPETAQTVQEPTLPLAGLENWAGSAEADGAANNGDEPPASEPKGRPRFRPIDRRQVRLVQLDVEALVGPDHPVRAIWQLVQQLDLEAYEQPIRAVEGVAGRTPHDVRVLISVWVYAFSMGVTSGREIERLFAYEPGLRWLSGDEKIGYHTLNNFRSQNEEALQQLFVTVLGVARAEGLIELKRAMQDGTKIRASAGSDSFRREKHIEEALAEAQEHVEQLLKAEAEANPQQSARQAAARRRAAEERVEKLKAASEALKQVEQTRKKKGKDPEQARASLTDPQARIMKQGGGGTRPAYNAQAVVDGKEGFITAAFVSPSSSDAQLLRQGVAAVEHNLGQKPKEIVADAGYTTQGNIAEMAEEQIEFYGSLPDPEKLKARNRTRDGPSAEFRGEAFPHDPTTDTCTCPEGKTLVSIGREVKEKTGRVVNVYRATAADCAGCPLKPQCCPKARRHGRTVRRTEEVGVLRTFREKMQTEEARAIYRERSQRAEFPFALIKQRFGLRQFRLRGLVKVGLEWLWACLTFNILQWIRLRSRSQPAQATT